MYVLFFHRAFQGHPRITKQKQKKNKTSRAIILFRTNTFQLASWVTSHMRPLRLSLSAQSLACKCQSDVSSHCHAEPHGCPTGKLKAASLCSDIQHK